MARFRRMLLGLLPGPKRPAEILNETDARLERRPYSARNKPRRTAMRQRCPSCCVAANMALASFLVLTSPSRMFSQDAVTLTQQGLELMTQGRYREAEMPLLRALELAGLANPTALYNVASVYHRQGRLREAERLHRLALEKIERVRGPFHSEVAQSLNDLGAIYCSLGRYSQAVAEFERALQILDRNPSDKLVATVLNNLAAIYYEIGQHDRAEGILRRALAVAESRRDEGRSDVPYILSSLGRIYFARKQYVEAESVFQRVVAISAGTLGVQHPDYAMALSNLALVYLRQKRFREAQPLGESAIAILERSAGREAPALAVPLEIYAEVLKALGRKSEARAIAQRAKSFVRPNAGTVDVIALRERRR